MTLRFEIDQAEAFRQGVNVEKSTNHLKVDPAELSQDDRNLFADRLDGIDVCKLTVVDNGRVVRMDVWPEEEANSAERKASMESRIIAKTPTFEALMEAIRENESEVRRAVEDHKRQTANTYENWKGK